MSFLSALFKSFPDQCRDGMRRSYLKHYELAKSVPTTMNPHHAGLFGALVTRYKRRGIVQQFSDTLLWAELAPFLLMSKEESLEALTEYVLWQEKPSAAKTPWLKTRINGALSNHINDKNENSLAPKAFFNNVKWCEFLDPLVRRTLSRAAAKL